MRGRDIEEMFEVGLERSQVSFKATVEEPTKKGMLKIKRAFGRANETERNRCE